MPSRIFRDSQWWRRHELPREAHQRQDELEAEHVEIVEPAVEKPSPAPASYLLTAPFAWPLHSPSGKMRSILHGIRSILDSLDS